MRIILTAPPDFDDYPLLKRVMDKKTGLLKKVILVTLGGMNTGNVLFLVLRWAGEWFYTTEVHHPDSAKYGKKASLSRRALDAVKNSDALVAFWDGRCSQTLEVIKLAREWDLKVKVVRY
jgi:hypothetical protein